MLPFAAPHQTGSSHAATTPLRTGLLITALLAGTSALPTAVFAQAVVPAVAPVAAGTSATVRQNTRLNAARARNERGAQQGKARPPESSQGQVTNANANAPTAGIFPFIPPFFTKFPGGEPLSVDTRGISFAAPDDSVKFRIGGRYQYDFSSVSVSPRVSAILPTDNDSRRAFFESYLTLNNGILVGFQYDFANVAQPIQDAVVAYHDPHNPVVVSVGNFKEPLSLNQLISDNNTTFLERSQMDGLVPARNFGGAIGVAGDRWTAVGGVFGGNANASVGPGNNGIAGTARVTYAPIMEKNQLLHVGVAGSYRALDANGLVPSFSSRPEDFLERALVTTGALRNSDDIARVNGEVLYQYGSYRIQGEYTYANVGGRNGQVDRNFQGGYVEGAWVVNGAGRPYRLVAPYGSEFAVLQGVQVDESQRISNGGFGVFEVAARYSALDLETRGVRGGSEQDVTAGLGWYPDRNIRGLFNYVHAWASPAAFSVAAGRNVESDAVVGRLQVYW